MMIRREALNAALAATTADDTRYYLHAVQVVPDQHAVVATNGHILLIAKDTAPQLNEDYPLVPGAPFNSSPTVPVLIAADTVRSIIAAMPKKSLLPILGCAQLSTNGTPQTFTLSATNLSAPCVATIDTSANGAGGTSNFPNYERVMPKADRQSINVCMAVDVLEDLIKAAKAIKASAKNGGAPKITFNVPTGKADTQDGAVISALGISMIGETVTVTGAAMPCRM